MGLLRDEEMKGGESKTGGESKVEESDGMEAAASLIQAKWRSRHAGSRLLDVARRVYEIGYDGESKTYFYYNKNTGESQWEAPKVLKALPPYRTDDEAKRAAVTMQGFFRTVMAKNRVKELIRAFYRREYDPESKQTYYLDTRTNEARWDAPSQLNSSAHSKKNSLTVKGEEAAEGDDDREEKKGEEEALVPLGGDSALLMARDKEIDELKKKLEAKEAEVEEAKKARYEELGQDFRVKRVAAALKGQKRSRHLEDWRTEQVVAWFMDMDLEEHAPALLDSKVTGLLLLNMDEEDLRELGIVKRIHLRKIELALAKYRRRYENRGSDSESEEDELSASDASEPPEEDASTDDEREKNDKALSPGIKNRDDDDALPTEDEILELQRDRKNIRVDVVFPGDEESFPEVGDVVRCHYVCLLDDSTQKEIENTRKKKCPVEFVLGIGQVILGIDRGLLQMSFGERSKIAVSPEYAYGAAGVPPLIPPRARLLIDVELLRWKPRPTWVKPLIQSPDLTQHPYLDPDDDMALDDALGMPM